MGVDLLIWFGTGTNPDLMDIWSIRVCSGTTKLRTRQLARKNGGMQQCNIACEGMILELDTLSAFFARKRVEESIC